MTNLELKGRILKMVGELNDAKTLNILHELLETLMLHPKKTIEKDDWWDKMTAEQQASLTKALAETEDPKKWISHEDVVKMSKQWLEQ